MSSTRSAGTLATTKSASARCCRSAASRKSSSVIDLLPGHDVSARVVDDVVGGEQPERGEPGRAPRGTSTRLHPERGRLGGGVHRAHPTERDQVEPARIGAGERQHPPHRVGHVRVDQRDDGGRGGLGVEAELARRAAASASRAASTSRRSRPPQKPPGRGGRARGRRR